MPAFVTYPHDQWTVNGGKAGGNCSDPWHELLLELDEIREHLDAHGMLKWSATIGDVQSRLTRQKETIKTLDQNAQEHLPLEMLAEH